MTSPHVKMIRSLYGDGEGSPSNPEKFNGQDYNQLKEMLLSQGEKFEDETFPPNLDSLGKIEDMTPEDFAEVEWLRPHEINPDAAFVVDGASRFDFSQGQVGNCWFLSAIGVLTLRKSLLAQVVPLDQSLKENYAGIFHFRFWSFGKWVDVVIDDRLPTLYKVPLSVSSKSGKEFWAPLLEKAYAKMCGSYGDTIAGLASEAFKDFSGGVHMFYQLVKAPSDLWDVINRAVQSKTMMGCGTFLGDKGNEICKKFGLVPGHIFSMTGVKEVKSDGEFVKLLRIWNPWGEKEWNGDWSDKSDLWDTVSSEERDKCLKQRNDGEFWMKMEDFLLYYEDLSICCDSPNFVDDDAACVWNCIQIKGNWEVGKSAGGSDCLTEEFASNPQYHVKVKNSKEGRNFLLSLMQKHDEEQRNKVEKHSVGFLIYKLSEEEEDDLPQPLPSSFFVSADPREICMFDESREVIGFYSLENGHYVIVPCTYECNKTSEFILTIYSKADIEMMEDDSEAMDDSYLWSSEPMINDDYND